MNSQSLPKHLFPMWAPFFFFCTVPSSAVLLQQWPIDVFSSFANTKAMHSANAPVVPQPASARTNLPPGIEYPFKALNTADLPADAVEGAIHMAVSLGITTVDFHLGTTFRGVGERDGVARAVASLGRSALTLITKLDKPPADMTDPVDAAKLARQTLDDEFSALGFNSVDILLLKDSTSCAVMQAQWAVLEEALASGRTRALGVYNYCEFGLKCLLANATTPPAFNFLMRHIGMGPDATGIIAFSASHGIRTTAYGTLGEPVALNELLINPTLYPIALQHGRTIEELALQWNAQSGFAISSRITANYAPDNEPNRTSYCTDHCRAALTAMAQLGEWHLTQEDMEQLDALRFSTYPQSPTYYSSSACDASFGVSPHPTASACFASISKWC